MNQYNTLNPTKEHLARVEAMRKYVVNENELIEAHPNKRIFIVVDEQRLCLRIFTRKTTDMEHIVAEFRETDTDAVFARRHSRGNIDLYKYGVSPFGYFSPGLLITLLEFLKGNPHINPLAQSLGTFCCISPGVMEYMKDWLLPLSQKVQNLGPSNIEVQNVSEDRTEMGDPMMMRDYQEEAIQKIITRGYGRGLVEAATGSGKSFIIANLIYTLHYYNLPRKGARTLIYVPNIQLVEQFYSDLLSYGYHEDELCRCSGALNTKAKKHLEKYGKTAPIVIANSAWCNNHLKELGKIDILLIDEAHRCTPGTVGFNTIKEVLFNCKVRVGFSGTLPHGYNLWELQGLTGPIIYKASITKLQDEGYLAGLTITKVRLNDRIVEGDTNLLFNRNSRWKMDDFNEDTGEVVGPNDAWIAEQDWYTNNCERIFAPVLSTLLLDDATSTLTNTLILFDRIELGHKLFGYLENEACEKGLTQRTISYIDGSVEVEKREEIRKGLEKTTGNILLGQGSILSTGINIKNLHRIILLAGGKAQAKIIQAIGRTLRLNAGKGASELIDVELNYRYSKRHASARKALYKEWYKKDRFDKEYRFDV